MPAGATYEAISTYTHTGGSTGQIDITSIPSTYTDLVVVGNVIYSANLDYMSYRLNGNSTNNNYAVQRMGFSSSTIDPSYGLDNKFVAYTSSLTQYVPFIMNINNYSSTVGQKSVLIRLHNTAYSTYYGGVFTPTSAITQVSLFFAASSIAAGTMLTVYGIKAA